VTISHVAAECNVCRCPPNAGGVCPREQKRLLSKVITTAAFSQFTGEVKIIGSVCVCLCVCVIEVKYVSQLQRNK